MYTIMAIKISPRTVAAPRVQEILTKYGCIIHTRIGLHEATENTCSTSGLILLNLTPSAEEEIKNLDNGVPSVKEEGIKTNVDESINSNESSKGEGLSDVQDKYSINEEESKSTEDTKTNDL